ncbi:MAG: hypothetical protein JWL62_3306 [Hyphomicrobiales bacterium]|nr:hypothetical protein [Hyphomicrobiales bacterium]
MTLNYVVFAVSSYNFMSLCRLDFDELGVTFKARTVSAYAPLSRFLYIPTRSAEFEPCCVFWRSALS